MIKVYKRIDLFGHLLFEKALIVPPFRAPNPMHEEACFLHVREGSYRSISMTEVLQVNARQSVLMKCGNYIGSMLGDADSGNYEAVAVHFHPEVLKKIYGDELPDFLVKRKRPYPKNEMELIHASETIDKYVQDVLFYFDHPHLLSDELLGLKVKEIILLLLQTPNADNIIQILENLFTARAVDFKTTVKAHIYSELSTAELAELTHMSISSFKRRFKENFGHPPQQYLMAKRLEKAKNLLLVSEESVQEIAYLCGFKTIHHFSKRFKDSYGLSPAKFRIAQRKPEMD